MPAPRSLPAAHPAAVLWDLDGTLLDSEAYWVEAETSLLAEHGIAWNETDALQLVGCDLTDGATILVERHGLPIGVAEITARLVESVRGRLEVETPWRPGARKLLAALRRDGIPMGLVTMSWTPLAEAFLSRIAALEDLGPETFAVVVTGDTVQRGKPHPDPYLVAAERLGVDIAGCVVVEDSLPGSASAVAAGAPTLIVPNAVTPPEHDGYSRWGSLDTVSVEALRKIAAGYRVDQPDASASGGSATLEAALGASRPGGWT